MSTNGVDINKRNPWYLTDLKLISGIWIIDIINYAFHNKRSLLNTSNPMFPEHI